VGNVDAGTVKLKDLDCDGNFNLQVTAGEVNAHLASVPSRNSNIQTDAGSLTLELPRNADADVTAKTEIGSISGLPGGKRKKGGDEIELGDLRTARFGKGGVKLTLQASTGSIHVAASGENTEEPVTVAVLFDGTAVAYPDPHRYDEADRKEMERAIRESQKEIAGSKEVHQDLSKLKPEIKAQIAAAMKEAKQTTAESMKMVHQQVEEAMKEVHLALSQQKLDPEMRKEIAAAIKEAQAETESSLKEAREEIRKAMKEIDVEIDDKELAASIKSMVKSAMDTALAATDQALKAANAGLKEAGKAAKKH
jgi:phage-related protein